MVAGCRTLWLWLSVGWLTEAVINPGSSPSSSSTSICDQGGPCSCSRGNLTCDCSTSFLKEVVLKWTNLDVSISSIRVTNCFHLHVTSNCLSRLSALQQVSVANVRQITLEERSFDWTTRDYHHTGLVVNITNCHIQQMPSFSFRGYIRDILFNSVNISRINTYAFGSLDYVDKLEFRRCSIKELETQSFKRISLEFISIFDSSISAFPERTITDVTVRQEVRFERVSITRLEKSSLKIDSSRNFRIINCKIGHIESKALELDTKGDVSIHDNVFFHIERHAFMGISVEERYLKEAGKQDFVFENNTLVEFENESLKLNTSGFDPRLDWIMVKQQCSCDGAKSWAGDLVLFSNVNPKDKPLSLERLIYCLNPKPTSIADFQRLNCGLVRFSVLTISVIVVLVVISLVVIALVVYCGVRKRGKKYINVPTSPSRLQPAEQNRGHILVVPDGKTYRETELHVILEHAEPIKTTNYVRDNVTNE